LGIEQRLLQRVTQNFRELEKTCNKLIRPKVARPHSATTFKVIMERPVDAERTRGPMPCLTSDAAFQVGNQPCRVRRVTPYSRLHPDRQFTAKPLRCHAHSSAQRVSRQRFRSMAQTHRPRCRVVAAHGARAAACDRSWHMATVRAGRGDLVRNRGSPDVPGGPPVPPAVTESDPTPDIPNAVHKNLRRGM